MEETMHIRTEVIDDVILLIEQMKRMNLPSIINEHMGRHWKQKGLDLGWTLSIWLAYVISEGDHRKLPVRAWAWGMHETLELVTGEEIRETDFTDDRLTIALHHLSDDTIWHNIECSLGRNLLRVYDVQKKTIRVDATTVSGYREGGEQSLWQFGHSKDDPTLRQIKLMMATLDPIGFPITLDVLAGMNADDPHYRPIIERVIEYFKQKWMLFVGDCKMSALLTRAFLQQAEEYYLTPLSQTGETAKHMTLWVAEGIARGKDLSKVFVKDGEEMKMIAEGYEIKRTSQSEDLRWEERVLVVRSPAFAQKQQKGLEQRIAKATAAIFALTKAPGKGRQQITDREKLVQAAEAILTKYQVTGMLSYTFQRESRQIEKYVGRGRGGPEREKRVEEVVRYQVTGVLLNAEAIAAHIATLGWRAYATNAPDTVLSFEEAILEYRSEYIVERGFGRLKGKLLGISPMYVKRDDQVVGLTRLLQLAVGVLTLVEGVVRRALQQQATSLAGLYLDSPAKVTATPTAERLLQAFTRISLTLVYLPDTIIYHVTPLSPVQKRILELLGFPPDLYAACARTIQRGHQVALA
jgi:transposase